MTLCFYAEWRHQLFYFISYTARCPRQTKNDNYFLPTFFRNIKAKKNYLC